MLSLACLPLLLLSPRVRVGPTVRPAAGSSGFSVRPMRRSDILPAASLLESSFAADRFTFMSPNSRSWLDVYWTSLLLALDIERRCTTWDWSRHLQLVAESAEGRLLGFVEVWGEDESSIGNVSAITPQPCLFNLCVSREMRRLGIARSLIERCEQTCIEWGESELFLKVRDDNEAAFELYSALNYTSFGTTEAYKHTPEWQASL
ncbi:MAG: hypothetical protein SGPRY_003299 [Prymnesium sp.]